MRRVLDPDEAIGTNPGRGYWGLAVVLSRCEATEGRHPLCHIGVTTLVRPKAFRLADIDTGALELVPYQNLAGNQVPSIFVYSAFAPPSVSILGSIDPAQLFSGVLSFTPGDGSDGGWPFRGTISPTLGAEAVHEWRRINDSERWQQEIREARSFNATIRERLKGT